MSMFYTFCGVRAIAVRKLNCYLVWIGGVVPDSKRVMPLAGAGPAADYLDVVAITWDESDTGRGPIGTAIRERRTVVCQDTAADPDFAPWREPALTRGYRSLAAAPLIHNSRLFGAIAVYADLPGAFDDEELRLLTELAADLAFALQTIEDERERRLAEENLVHAKIAAEAANNAKSDFLANMSHEIRTPMTAILGFGDLLTMPNLSQQERCEYVEGIQRNGKALLELLGNILDLSKIEAEKLTLDGTYCSLPQIIDDVVAAVQVRSQEKQLDLQIDYKYPLPEIIYTDPLRLRQILVNLMGNAVKFTEQGGVRLTVCFLREAVGPARIQFTVSDSGIGIPADKISLLFQPFMQVDGSTTRRYGGTGLGLAISKRLAAALGGNLEVASRHGRGSTFTLTIDPGSLEGTPMLQSPQTGLTKWTKTSPVNHESPLHGRLLLVEDAPDLQRLVSLLLRKMNLEVEVADGGQAACDMVEKSKTERRPYDLILMDIQMPEMNGYDATRELRRRDWQGSIVAMTACAMTGDREKCLAAGCDDYIAKPVLMTGLRDVLVRYLKLAADPPNPAPVCLK
jgi:signal transduction histidine kinase/ActR/RegA family two-component response regulator